MHVLVTGGTGFIGQGLVPALAAEGHRVTVLTRDPGGARGRVAPGTRLVAELPELDADPPGAVVNLAGQNLGQRRWNAARKQAFLDSRAGTTRRLVAWMHALPRRPRVLVSGSAVGYYGARGGEPLAEDAAPAGEYQSELCRAWEEEARRAEADGVRVCRIRTGIVLGRGGALAQMLPPFRLGLGGHIGSGAQWMSWIHRTDLVALILWLIAGGERAGAYNATSPEPVTNRDFARTLGRVLRRPAVVPVPAFAVRLLVGEMAHLLLTGQRVVPERALAQGFAFRFPDLEGALREILAA